jgi:diguanylate cyclase (GGDEF)-like protein
MAATDGARDESDPARITAVSLDPGPPRASGEACLVTIHGPDLGRRTPLDRPRLGIGRDPDNDLVIGSDSVSRRHCEITSEAGRVCVRDLGSTNGTQLGENALASGETRELRPGDLLRVGGVILKFLDGSDVEALYHEELYRSTVMDGLTRVHNRRYLTDFLEREMARCRRHDRPLALLLLDIDHFKEINDRRGHLAGDAVLRELAALLHSSVRREECLARYGGEEFAIVLPDTPLAGARSLARRLRAAVEAHGFAAAGVRIEVTVSIGAAELHSGMRDTAAFLAAADAQLYRAKASGRNAVAG